MKEKEFASESTPLVESDKKVSRDDEVGNNPVKGGPTFAKKRRKTVMFSQTELTHLVDAFTEEDEDKDKTWGRRLVEKYLEKQSWYFPGSNVKDGPSLSRAWAFFGRKNPADIVLVWF